MTRRGVHGVGIALLIGLASPSVALAGMPAITLTEIARLRVQTISFFLMGFLLCAWAVQGIWNSLRRDFPLLPRLSFARASGVVALWGLLFLLVLTMISGARELMTPGAWKKVGYTSKLAEDTPEKAAALESERFQSLDALRLTLWTYARGHGGAFPSDDHTPEIPEEAWKTPDPSGMRYVYVKGLTADKGSSPLVYEPGIFGGDRLILQTDGKIRRVALDSVRKTYPEGAER